MDPAKYFTCGCNLWILCRLEDIRLGGCFICSSMVNKTSKPWAYGVGFYICLDRACIELTLSRHILILDMTAKTFNTFFSHTAKIRCHLNQSDLTF